MSKAIYYPGEEAGDSLFNKIARTANSSFLLMLSFVICNTFLEISIASLARFLGYGVKITYNVVGVVPRDWHYWSRVRVMVVYLTAPLLCLAIGLLLFNFLKTNKGWVNTFRLFIFWLMICFINLALSHLFFSPLGIREFAGMGYYQTFAIVGTWMGLNSGIMGLFAGAAIVASVGLGVACRNEVLKFSYSSRLIKRPSGKSSIVFQLYVLPVLITTYPLISLCTKANVFPSAFMSLNLVIISIGMFVRNFNDASAVRCEKGDVLNHFPLIEFVFCMTAWLLVYRFFK